MKMIGDSSMALRGKKPEKIEKRLKMFIYGAAGVGKSTCAISFPSPYVIDCEKGLENDSYVDLIVANKGVVFKTLDFKEVMTEVKALLSEKHEYKTLVIDPITLIYSELVDQFAITHGTDYGKNVTEANRQFKRLLSLILRLDMSVVLTSHAKNEYSAGGGMTIVGQTFDSYKKIDYLFDLIIEAKKIGNNRFGVVKKTRITSFKDNEEFDFSYDAIANKYGKKLIEKDAKPQTLATKEQVKELVHYLDLLKVPDEVVAKWLKAAEADELEDMPQEFIVKCIASLQDKINAKGEK